MANELLTIESLDIIKEFVNDKIEESSNVEPASPDFTIGPGIKCNTKNYSDFDYFFNIYDSVEYSQSVNVFNDINSCIIAYDRYDFFDDTVFQNYNYLIDIPYSSNILLDAFSNIDDYINLKFDSDVNGFDIASSILYYKNKFNSFEIDDADIGIRLTTLASYYTDLTVIDDCGGYIGTALNPDEFYWNVDRYETQKTLFGERSDELDDNEFYPTVILKNLPADINNTDVYRFKVESVVDFDKSGTFSVYESDYHNSDYYISSFAYSNKVITLVCEGVTKRRTKKS